MKLRGQFGIWPFFQGRNEAIVSGSSGWSRGDGHWLPFGMLAFLRIVVNVVLPFILDWRMALVMICVLPVTFLLPRRFIRRATVANLHASKTIWQCSTPCKSSWGHRPSSLTPPCAKHPPEQARGHRC